MKKINFSMLVNEFEKDIMEFITEVQYGQDFSKSDVIMNMFRCAAYNYLGINDDDDFCQAIPDYQLIGMLRNRKRQEDYRLIDMVGIDQFKAEFDKFKKEHPEVDCSETEKTIEGYINGKKPACEGVEI